MSSKEEILRHLEHLKQLAEEDYIVSLTTIFLGENDRAIGNNVGEPLAAHGILLMEDMVQELKDDFMESPVKPHNRLRALGPEGGFIVVGDDGEPLEDDDDIVDDDELEDDDD